ncbi:MAG: biosynthetic-type acetolactate synthase large subunit [Bacteroidales bacterium]|nr:biosynthetic-type acetolactate synthase large subunit [Bacteroidales bacterium]
MATLTQTTKEKTAAPATQKVSGSDAVIRSLLAEGVDLVFGYPGGAIMPVYDSLYQNGKKIEHILTRHEQGAIHAAEAFAKISGKVGVVFATSGPGATNLVTGLSNAKIDSTPLVCITGQVTSNLLGFDAFQETDMIGISMPVTKWNYQITKAEEIPLAFAKAFYIACSGRPGPVLLDITKDALLSSIENFSYQKVERISGYYPYPKIDMEKVREAANLINNAKKPLILAGQGITISGAEKELETFVNKTGIPVAATLFGLTAFPSKHPLFVGMLGMHGNYAPNIKTNEADLIIAIGMRFDDRVTGDTSKYAKNAKVIHIDIDAAEIDKNIKTKVAVVSDAKKALEKLISLVQKNNFEEWLNEFKDLDKVEQDEIIAPNIAPKGKALRMAEVVHRVSEMTKGDPIVVTDVGQHQMMAARYYKFLKPKSIITSGGLGTMGFGLPAAVGAGIAGKDRGVILFVGDGGFQMTIQELATLWHYKIPVKIVLLNNNFLGMVRQWQQLFFDKRYACTTMHNPDFVKIAEGFGLKSRKVQERAELDGALSEMLDSDTAYLLVVEVEKEGNVFPMVPAGAAVSEMILKP